MLVMFKYHNCLLITCMYFVMELLMSSDYFTICLFSFQLFVGAPYYTLGILTSYTYTLQTFPLFAFHFVYISLTLIFIWLFPE